MNELSRRPRAIVTAGLAVLMALFSAGPAAADTAPITPSDPKTPVTVAADPLPTVQINGVVWQQLVIGNTVYAAGNFSSARPAGSAAGVNEVQRNNLLAYDLVSGSLKTEFVANLNSQAKTLAKSPDGSRLYVGGDFTTVNGESHSRVAALNPISGTPIATFTAAANASVNALAASADKVYLGGSFSAVNGAGRSQVAAVTPTGGLLAAFRPVAAGGDVQAMVLSPDGRKLVLGGSFTTLNGSSNPGYGLGSVDSSTGTNLTFNPNQTIRNGGANAAITSLSSDATNIYGTGYVFGAGGNFEGAFSAAWSDTNLTWLEDCHGDTYGVYASSTAVYTASHSHFCGNVGGFPETATRSFHRALAFSKAATGTVQTNSTGSYFNYAGQPAPSLQTWFPDINTGTYTGLGQGPWTVTGAGSYVLYGGEFTTVNATAQQGLVRFATKDLAANKEGPRASNADFQPAAAEVSPGTVKISWPANWDRDNANLTYTVTQDGVAIGTVTAASNFWSRPTLSYTATGVPAGSHVYKVSAADAFGNSVTSPPVTTNQSVPTLTARSPGGGTPGVAATASTKVTFSEDVTGVSATSFNLKRNGTAVPATVTYDSATRVATLTPTTALADDTTYTVLLTSAIKSLSGGALVPQSWNYITGPAPIVTATNPAHHAAGIANGTAASPTKFNATFSEPVTGLPSTSASTVNFTLKLGSTLVASHVLYDPATRVATLTADAPLTSDKTYTLSLKSAIKDLGGNPIATKTWTVITGPRPVATTRAPAPGATGVSRTANVSAAFSEAVTGLPTTPAASSSFTIKQTSTNTAVTSAASYNTSTKTATLDPSSNLLANTTYTVTLSNTIKDIAGNPFIPVSWTFTTGAS